MVDLHNLLFTLAIIFLLLAGIEILIAFVLIQKDKMNMAEGFYYQSVTALFAAAILGAISLGV